MRSRNQKAKRGNGDTARLFLFSTRRRRCGVEKDERIGRKKTRREEKSKPPVAADRKGQWRSGADKEIRRLNSAAAATTPARGVDQGNLNAGERYRGARRVASLGPGKPNTAFTKGAISFLYN